MFNARNVFAALANNTRRDDNTARRPPNTDVIQWADGANATSARVFLYTCFPYMLFFFVSAPSSSAAIRDQYRTNVVMRVALRTASTSNRTGFRNRHRIRVAVAYNRWHTIADDVIRSVRGRRASDVIVLFIYDHAERRRTVANTVHNNAEIIIIIIIIFACATTRTPSLSETALLRPREYYFTRGQTPAHTDLHFPSTRNPLFVSLSTWYYVSL